MKTIATIFTTILIITSQLVSAQSKSDKMYDVFENKDGISSFSFSKNMIDAGADVVFGHGPHVTRAIDMYKGKIITYSMGNFATYGRFDLSGVKGIAPIIKFKINKKMRNSAMKNEKK